MFLYGEIRPGSTEQNPKKNEQKDQQKKGAQRIQRPHITSVGMDLYSERALFQRGDDGESGNREDEIENNSPIERIAWRMLALSDRGQKTVGHMNAVNQKGDEPDDCDPGKTATSSR